MGAHGIYHERQIRELCALHALNNLFQGNFVFSVCQALFFRFRWIWDSNGECDRFDFWCKESHSHVLRLDFTWKFFLFTFFEKRKNIIAIHIAPVFLSLLMWSICLCRKLFEIDRKKKFGGILFYSWTTPTIIDSIF